VRTSIGIDSWPVDHGLLDAQGALLGNPVHYRDARTDGVMDGVRREVGSRRLYDVSGLQFLPFNTIYQLVAAGRSGQPDQAETLLLIPDLVAYWLTGELGAEITNASTTGLLDVRTREWAHHIAAQLGIPQRLFPPLRRPGDPAGTLRPDVAAETGLPAATPVTTVASHDTAEPGDSDGGRGQAGSAGVTCRRWMITSNHWARVPP
jgi:rhamnulokinase